MCLRGLGVRRVVGDPVVLAVVGELLAGEALLDDVQRLFEAVDAHRGRVVLEPERVVVGLHPARADAELEPAVAQQVDRRGLLGEDRRVLVVVVEHERADLQRRGVRGRHRDRRHRRQLLAEVVGHEQRRVPEVFELARLVAPRRRRRRVRDLHSESEGLRHVGSYFPARRATTGASVSVDSIGTTMYDICQRSRRCSSSSMMLSTRADERGRREHRVGLRHAERARHRLGDPRRVVGDVHEPEQRLDLEIGEPVARGFAQPRELLIGRLGKERLRGLARLALRPVRRFALIPTIFASRAASPRIFFPPPPMRNGRSAPCGGFGMPSSSVTW